MRNNTARLQRFGDRPLYRSSAYHGFVRRTHRWLSSLILAMVHARLPTVSSHVHHPTIPNPNAVSSPIHHPGGCSRALVFTNELSTRGTVHGDAMRARIRRSRPTLASRGVHARSGRAHGTEGSGMERRNAQFAGVRVRVDAWNADGDGMTENQDARSREDSTRGNEVRSLERWKFV